jgi:hypothetical protein
VLRAVKVFRVMRLSTANSMSAKRHRTLGLVDVDSVHSRIFKLVFWLGGIIFMATGALKHHPHDVVSARWVAGPEH